MGMPTVRLVFDRKHVAARKRKGLVQMEICHERKRRWIGMGRSL
ncbi:MAG: hypothetical protein SO098_03075 [Prevotella sp.]|nr:hypothetical protein [Prevotella sp.]